MQHKIFVWWINLYKQIPYKNLREVTHAYKHTIIGDFRFSNKKIVEVSEVCIENKKLLIAPMFPSLLITLAWKCMYLIHHWRVWSIICSLMTSSSLFRIKSSAITLAEHACKIAKIKKYLSNHTKSRKNFVHFSLRKGLFATLYTAGL